MPNKAKYKQAINSIDAINNHHYLQISNSSF